MALAEVLERMDEGLFALAQPGQDAIGFALRRRDFAAPLDEEKVAHTLLDRRNAGEKKVGETVSYGAKTKFITSVVPLGSAQGAQDRVLLPRIVIYPP
ncbi:hypothetical protein NKJ74_23135 [Mesorhizobium sp. M0046]